MNIIIVQSGPSYEVLLLLSVLIGLKKKYPQSKILWVGEPEYFQLVKFNKRVNKCLNINKSGDLVSLTDFYNSDVCYNPSLNSNAKKFATTSNSNKYYGFNNNGPVNRNAVFFEKIISGESSTRKTILDVYYDLADIKWKGEGYGLGYYPKTKQIKNIGIYYNPKQEYPEPPNTLKTEQFILPDNLLNKFDTINQFSCIVTNDLFTLHAAIALRKKVVYTKKLNYNINFQKG